MKKLSLVLLLGLFSCEECPYVVRDVVKIESRYKYTLYSECELTPTYFYRNSLMYSIGDTLK